MTEQLMPGGFSRGTRRPRPALDERQQGIRARIVSRAFAVILLAAWLNGALVDRWGAWGSATDQALAQLWLALALVTVPSIWRGAYFRRPADVRLLTALSALVVLLAGAATVLKAARGRLDVWRHGHAGADFQLTLMGGYSALVCLTLLARWALDRRTTDDEENEPAAGD